MTPEEFNAYTSCYLPQKQGPSIKSPLVPSGGLPAMVDWRPNMSAVKDQGACGSCYAESAIAAFEGAWSIRSGRVHNFSVQEVIDCSAKEGNEGCNGGWMHAVYEYIMDHEGILLDSSDPYSGMSKSCAESHNETVAYLTNWSFVKPTQHSILLWLTLQPISIAVDANECWQSYTGGILSSTNCPSSLDPPELDHGVVVVGYNLEHTIPYFIVRNSWGVGWGEDGYVRIAINESHGSGLFGLAQQPTVPHVGKIY